MHPGSRVASSVSDTDAVLPSVDTGVGVVIKWAWLLCRLTNLLPL